MLVWGGVGLHKYEGKENMDVVIFSLLSAAKVNKKRNGNKIRARLSNTTRLIIITILFILAW